MRKLMILFVSLVLVFTLQTSLFATDSVNDTVNVIESAHHVVFFGQAEFTVVTTDDAYTKAFSVIGGDWYNASLYVYGNAEASIDINGFLQGSAQLSSTETNWVNGFTHSGLDALGAAQCVVVSVGQDTTSNGTPRIDPVCNQRFQRLRFDGQTGNPAAALLYWYLVVPKTAISPSRNAWGVWSTS